MSTYTVHTPRQVWLKRWKYFSRCYWFIFRLHSNSRCGLYVLNMYRLQPYNNHIISKDTTQKRRFRLVSRNGASVWGFFFSGVQKWALLSTTKRKWINKIDHLNLITCCRNHSGFGGRHDFLLLTHARVGKSGLMETLKSNDGIAMGIRIFPTGLEGSVRLLRGIVWLFTLVSVQHHTQ